MSVDDVVTELKTGGYSQKALAATVSLADFIDYVIWKWEGFLRDEN